MQRFLKDAELRQRMGEAARLRAEELYAQQKVTGALMDFYADVLGHT